MKLLHTSDWHFGMSVGTGSYEEDQRYFLSQLYEIIQQEHIGAVLLAGDVYDSGISNAAAINLYNEAVTTICCKLQVPMIIIAGNHDNAARLAACRTLLRSAGLYITGKLEQSIEPVLLDQGKVAVYSLPFFNKDEVAAMFPDSAKARTQEQAMDYVCSNIRNHMDPGRKNIVLSHALIVGSELSDSDRSARIGMATAVSKDVFDGFDYVALGHIHKPQAIANHIRYSGSPLKYSFGGEETQEKGVILIDTDSMDISFKPLKLLRDRKTVCGSFDDLIGRDDLKNCYLRLEVTDRYAGLELWSELYGHFPYLLELKGKALDQNTCSVGLSLEELHQLDETAIMERFLAEHYSCEPTTEQLAQFQDVLTWSLKEEDAG